MLVLERCSTADRLLLNLQRFSHQDQPHSKTVSIMTRNNVLSVDPIFS